METVRHYNNDVGVYMYFCWPKTKQHVISRSNEVLALTDASQRGKCVLEVMQKIPRTCKNTVTSILLHYFAKSRAVIDRLAMSELPYKVVILV